MKQKEYNYFRTNLHNLFHLYFSNLKLYSCNNSKETEIRLKTLAKISKLIKAFPKDIAALDKRVLQKIRFQENANRKVVDCKIKEFH